MFIAGCTDVYFIYDVNSIKMIKDIIENRTERELFSIDNAKCIYTIKDGNVVISINECQSTILLLDCLEGYFAEISCTPHNEKKLYNPIEEMFRAFNIIVDHVEKRRWKSLDDIYIK